MEEKQLAEIEVQEPQVREYIPSRKQFLRENSIRIAFCSRGCIIDIGCKTIPFETIEAGMEALNDYVKDPHAQRKIWDKILE
jgi:hypothetical protein